MAATEDDIIRDEQERSNWQRVIADVEAAIAASTPGTRRAFENTLESAKKRVATLDKKIEDAKVERHAAEQAKIAAASLAEKEKALSASERETYSGFLKAAFFTKKDFGKLEQFYAHTYDRLSEGGKDELSHRVWEGVRHGEYRFTDLPKDVQEKEAKRAYAKLAISSNQQGRSEQIPEADRADFIRAYEAGDHRHAAEILNRDSFGKNLGLDSSAGVKHRDATIAKTADDKSIVADDKPMQQDASSTETSPMSKIALASASLKSLTLADSHSAPSAASIPDASASQVNGRSPA